MTGAAPASTGQLALYDAARHALAEAKRIDEVKDIRDRAVALATYARQANNRDLEADAVEIRLRAVRRLGEMMAEQAKTVGLNQGAVPGKTGLRGNPVLDSRPTLKSQGIDKTLAHQARILSRQSSERFEETIAHARDSVVRASRHAIKLAEIEQDREAYAARITQGGTVGDLHALIASGYRAGVLYIDFPLRFEIRNVRGKARTPERYYD
jgi:hypothetical protein